MNVVPSNIEKLVTLSGRAGGIITKLPEKEDLADCNNWRDINILCVALSLNENNFDKNGESGRQVLDKVPENQAGFTTIT